MRKVVFLGSHPDDIELNVGPLALSMNNSPNYEVFIVKVFEPRYNEFFDNSCQLYGIDSNHKFSFDVPQDCETFSYWNYVNKFEKLIDLDHSSLVISHDMDREVHPNHVTTATLAKYISRNCSLLTWNSITNLMDDYSGNLAVRINHKYVDKAIEYLKVYEPILDEYPLGVKKKYPKYEISVDKMRKAFSNDMVKLNVKRLVLSI